MKGRACGVAAAIALIAAPAADAAFVGLRPTAGPVPELAVLGLTGEANRITMRATLAPANTEWTVTTRARRSSPATAARRSTRTPSAVARCFCRPPPSTSATWTTSSRSRASGRA
jgi:hypothetical protein